MPGPDRGHTITINGGTVKPRLCRVCRLSYEEQVVDNIPTITQGTVGGWYRRL